MTIMGHVDRRARPPRQRRRPRRSAAIVRRTRSSARDRAGPSPRLTEDLLRRDLTLKAQRDVVRASEHHGRPRRLLTYMTNSMSNSGTPEYRSDGRRRFVCV
jgi:hypothetical protein